MSTPTWSQVTEHDIAQAQQAASLLGPRWTTHILQTLRQTGPIRQRDVIRAIPDAPPISLRAALTRLTDARLLTPVRGPRAVRYHLTTAGQATQPVHEAVIKWVQDHSPAPGRTPPATQVEQALHALSLAHALSVLKELADAGPLPCPELAPRLPARPNSMALYHQLRKLVEHGLAERREGEVTRFLITPGAKILPPVINALATYTSHLPPASHPSPRPAHRTSHQIPQRSAFLSYRPGDLFSHPAPPHPSTPTPARRNR